MNIRESFNKANDYTLQVDTQTSDYARSHTLKISSCTQIFNFLRRQQTTIHRDMLVNNDPSAAPAIVTHVITENFEDMTSTAEVKLMHRKLVELGGKPPSIEEVLGGLSKNAGPGLLK